MEFAFSTRMNGLNPSAIREILKSAAGKDVIPFSAGNPAPEAFPVKEITEISNRILIESPIATLQYGVTEGYAPLLSHIKSYMRGKYGVGGDFTEAMITSGAQQGIELVAKVLCDLGDVVICEDPSFIGSLNSFRSIGCRLVGVPVEDDGMDMDKLEAALKAEPRCKMIYTIPNFQNPTGITMSLAKRKRMLELAKQYGVIIVEDNPYGDLRYAGEDVPAIQTMDTDGHVLYVGSFSKVVSPAMRVGYAIGHPELIKKMVVCKQGEDVHSSQWAQMVIHTFMTEYDYEAHLDGLRTLYREKQQKMCSLLNEKLVPLGIQYPPTDGGLFTWCRLPATIDAATYVKRAIGDYRTTVIPGSAFAVDTATAPMAAFRINFSTPTMEQMERGVENLEKLALEMLG